MCQRKHARVSTMSEPFSYQTVSKLERAQLVRQITPASLQLSSVVFVISHPRDGTEVYRVPLNLCVVLLLLADLELLDLFVCMRSCGHAKFKAEGLREKPVQH